MNWLTFIVEISKTWAWPITVIVLFLLLRKTIPSLIDRLRSLKYGTFEAAFAGKSVEIAENISKTPNLLHVQHDENTLLHLAQQSPLIAISEAWGQLEQKLLELSKKSHIPTDNTNARAIAKLLHDDKIINKKTLNAVEGLHQLRNLAVHAPEKELSSQKATDFITLAQVIIWTLDNQPE